MFDLYVTENVKKDLRDIKKELRKVGYKEYKQKTNNHIGGLHLYYDTFTFYKGNIMFQFEIDKNYNMLTTRLYLDKEVSQISLSSVLDRMRLLEFGF